MIDPHFCLYFPQTYWISVYKVLKGTLKQNHNFRDKFLTGSNKSKLQMAVAHLAGNKKHLREIIVNLETCIQGEILLKLGIGLKFYIYKDLFSICELTRNY